MLVLVLFMAFSIVVAILGICSKISTHAVFVSIGIGCGVSYAMLCLLAIFVPMTGMRNTTDLGNTLYDVTSEDFELQKDDFTRGYFSSSDKDGDTIYYWREINGEVVKQKAALRRFVILDSESTSARIFHRTYKPFDLPCFLLGFNAHPELDVLVVGSPEAIDAWYQAQQNAK